MNRRNRIRFAAATAFFGIALLAPFSTSALSTYADGTKINLATIRGATATASANVGGGYTLLEPLHPAYGTEIRWNNSFTNPCWYQLDLGGTFNLSNYTAYFHGVITSVNMSVKASTTPLTDAQWGVLAPLTTFSGSVTGAPGNGSSNNAASGSFTEVPARYVRLDFASQEGWSQMIVQTLKFTGNNSAVPVNNRISLAQTTWAGAQTSYSDPWFTLSGPANAHVTTIQPNGVIGDDFNLLQQYWPNADGTGTVPPGTPPVDPLPQEASRFYVLMNDKYIIDAVAWTSIGDGRRVKDMDIYGSTSVSGNDWFLVKSLTSLPNTGGPTAYYEVALDAPTTLQRVRFDALRVWNTSFHPTLNIADGYFGEFYVYGSIPEPATAVLLGLAGLGLLSRRRR